MTTARNGARLTGAVLLSYVACACAGGEQPATEDLPGTPTPEERIVYFAEVVAQDPAHWPALAHLGSAYLDRARETHDPSMIRSAREALERSFEVQPNFEAQRARAALENFCHRFAEGLHWADRAAEAAEDPSEVVAPRVEALLGLGRNDEARDVLQSVAGTRSFHALVARSHWLVAEGRMDEAVLALDSAADVAKDAGAEDLRVWALVRCGGVLLDAGRADEAEPFLARAAEIAPGDRFLGIHEAELLEAQGRPEDALAAYRTLLARQGDPALHAKAFELCTGLGQETEAQEHFRSAETGFRAVLDAGEVFTLAALAELYLAADHDLEEAVSLSERNLIFERDAAAHELAERARARFAASTMAR